MRSTSAGLGFELLHPSNCCTPSSLRVCIPSLHITVHDYVLFLKEAPIRPWCRVRATQQSAKSEKVRKVSWRGSSLHFYNDNGQYGKWYKGTALLRRMRIYTKQQKTFATYYYTRFDYSVQYYYIIVHHLKSFMLSAAVLSISILRSVIVVWCLYAHQMILLFLLLFK